MEFGSAVMLVSFNSYLSAPGGACHRNGVEASSSGVTSICTERGDSSESDADDSCKRYPSCCFSCSDAWKWNR